MKNKPIENFYVVLFLTAILFAGVGLKTSIDYLLTPTNNLETKVYVDQVSDEVIAGGEVLTLEDVYDNTAKLRGEVHSVNREFEMFLRDTGYAKVTECQWTDDPSYYQGGWYDCHDIYSNDPMRIEFDKLICNDVYYVNWETQDPEYLVEKREERCEELADILDIEIHNPSLIE